MLDAIIKNISVWFNEDRIEAASRSIETKILWNFNTMNFGNSGIPVILVIASNTMYDSVEFR